MPTDVWTEQQRLSIALGAWSAASVVTGLSLRRRSTRPSVHAAGRQTAMWGAVDAVIAVGGAWRRRQRLTSLPEPYDADVVARERRSLRRLLLTNAALDVGYVAGGAVLARSGPRLSRYRARWAASAPGDGLAIVVQGCFLFGLDVIFAHRVARVGRPEPTSGWARPREEGSPVRRTSRSESTARG